MTKSLLSLALAATLSVGIFSPTLAQEKKPDQKPPQAAKAEEKKPDQAKTEEKKPELTKEQKLRKEQADDYDKAVKDLKKFEGNFTLYLRKKDVLMEIPEDKIDKVFLMQATMQTGGADQDLQAGDPLGAYSIQAFKFQRNEDSLWLTRPNMKYRWDKNDPLAIASERSFPKAILGSFRIEQQNPEKKLLLVNVTPIFGGDLFRLGETVGLALGGPYMMDREKTWPDKIKSFPDNTVVQMQMHFVSARGGGGDGMPGFDLFGIGDNPQLEDPRSAPLRVTYNMWFRKDSDYMPRLADTRVGYFTEDYYSVDKFLNDDRMERYIMRWNLKKKDPTAALSEPVKPITWVIDPSVPPQYRDSVKEGLLRWNKAFEQVGFKNAVVVTDPPKDVDYDHSDGRFNVVRWTMSENTPYAVSHFRTDPFTGEILNAAITFDANLVSFAMQEHRTVATPAATLNTRTMEVLKRDPNRDLSDDDLIFSSQEELTKRVAENKLKGLGWSNYECMEGPGLAKSAAYALNITTAMGHGMKVSKETYAKQFISDVIQHEAGHCIGLRHNFAGSTNLTTKELSDDALTSKEGIAASVMDYVPVNVMAALKGSGNFFSPTIGKYDVWAVKYGYTDTKSASPQAEKPALSEIAKISGNHGYEYLSDENADNWDPYAVRFDSGRDAVNYNEKMLEAAKKVKAYAIEELPRSGESYSKRTELILDSIAEAFHEGQLAARFVGGVHSVKNFRSDSGERRTLAPVSAADQRQAVSLIAQNLLSSDAFNFPESVLQNLSIDPNSSASRSWTAPLRQILATQQERMLSKLLSAATTDRITENQYKSGKADKPYTIDEHYGLILSTVFNEVGKNQPIQPVRRDLQRFTTTVLMVQASAPSGSVSEDVRMLANDALRRLDSRFQTQIAKPAGLDEMTRVHLRDTQQEIHRFLNRQFLGLGN